MNIHRILRFIFLIRVVDFFILRIGPFVDPSFHGIILCCLVVAFNYQGKNVKRALYIPLSRINLLVRNLLKMEIFLKITKKKKNGPLCFVGFSVCFFVCFFFPL